MKRVIILSIASIASIGLEASSVQKAFEDAKVEGYVRAAHQSHDVKNADVSKDSAIGGKLHIETGAISGIYLGASFYTSNALGNSDNGGLVPFRAETRKSYSILGEAYLKAVLGNTTVKIGRQEIDTPFVETDDIGMVPNTFEAAVLVNTDIADTSIFLAQVQKMAGVDAKVIDEFTRVNGRDNMQVLGVSYDGVKNLALSAWYYNLKNAEVESIAYFETSYEGTVNDFGYGLGVQYAKQGYSVGDDATVMGVTASVAVESIGLALTTAYNQSKDNATFSGFGGGPFFSNSEYLIVDNAGVEGKQTLFGVEFDAATVGVEGLTLGLSKVTLENEAKQEATEVDFVLSYEMNENVEMHLIYSDLKGLNVGEDEAKNLRVFANYSF